MSPAQTLTFPKASKAKPLDSIAVDLTRKVPPNDLEAESSVLGGILVKNDVYYEVAAIIQAEDFYSPTHQTIFLAVSRLITSRHPADLLTVTEELKGSGTLEEVGGPVYLAELAGSTIAAANAAAHARIVKDKATRRRLIHAGVNIIDCGFDPTDQPEALVGKASRFLTDVGDQAFGSDIMSSSELVLQVMDDIQARTRNRGATIGVPTGYTDIDQLLSGLNPSDLIIMAGRPGMGKTALAVGMACNAALDRDKAVAFFSLEMGKKQIFERALCARARVNTHSVRRGFLSNSDHDRLYQASDLVAAARFWVDDTAAMRPAEIAARCRTLKRTNGLDLVVVDYLQLMRSDTKEERREQEVSSVSRALKALAKDLNVPVLALAQLNREVEKRSQKRPQLSDLRDSGAIEQDADVILFLHNDDYNSGKRYTSEATTTDVIVAKHRHGPTGLAKLAFLPPFAAFENQASEFEGMED